MGMSRRGIDLQTAPSDSAMATDEVYWIHWTGPGPVRDEQIPILPSFLELLWVHARTRKRPKLRTHPSSNGQGRSSNGLPVTLAVRSSTKSSRRIRSIKLRLFFATSRMVSVSSKQLSLVSSPALNSLKVCTPAVDTDQRQVLRRSPTDHRWRIPRSSLGH